MAMAPPPALVVAALPEGLQYAGAHRFCNDSDDLAQMGKVVWHVRHGQSEGNVAKHAAKERDAREAAAAPGLPPSHKHARAYEADPRYVDAPLSAEGIEQAESTAGRLGALQNQPTLIVSSPMTRALQTADIVFAQQLQSGTARLVIRPELREFFSRMQESRGRTLAELLACPRLASPQIQTALREAAAPASPGMAADDAWGEAWDTSLAAGVGYAGHVESSTRLEQFRVWLAAQPEQHIACVSHWGEYFGVLRAPSCKQLPPSFISPMI